MKRTHIIAYMGTFACITPIGIAIGIGLVQSASNNNASNGPAAVLNGLAAGTLLYVVFFEILEKERQKKSNGLLQVSIGSLKVFSYFGYLSNLYFFTFFVKIRF